jgi:hypothetical protein
VGHANLRAGLRDQCPGLAGLPWPHQGAITIQGSATFPGISWFSGNSGRIRRSQGTSQGTFVVVALRFTL